MCSNVQMYKYTRVQYLSFVYITVLKRAVEKGSILQTVCNTERSQLSRKKLQDFFFFTIFVFTNLVLTELYLFQYPQVFITVTADWTSIPYFL